MKRYWDDTHEYMRILESLDAYWLTEKDEKFVCVTMYFEHADGQYQEKTIRWTNPKYKTGNSAVPVRASEVLDIVGMDSGGALQLHRDQDGNVVGLKNLRTGHVDYFK